MTDINFLTNSDNVDAASQGDRPSEALIDLIELLFFAYRDFISDPDAILAKYGFGRARARRLIPGSVDNDP